MIDHLSAMFRVTYYQLWHLHPVHFTGHQQLKHPQNRTGCL